jgi:membrane protease subunit HflK
VIQAAESAMREVVGRKTMDSVLYESRQQIADEVRSRMQEMLDRYGTGILVSAVAIQNAQPPEQVQAAFDDAVKAGQDRERQINEGQAYANDVVPKARGAASRLMQEAEGYRTRIVQTAEGDASRFRQILTEYQKAPAVTRDRMYLDTMQQVFANTTKVMVDSRTGNQLLYLPFDKLMQQVTQDATAPRAATVTPAPLEPASPTSDGRTRDSLRSRDREAR